MYTINDLKYINIYMHIKLKITPARLRMSRCSRLLKEQ